MNARAPRAAAPDVHIDLARPDHVIHADLATRYAARHPAFWWELDDGDRAGWVYAEDGGKVLGRLVHAAAPTPKLYTTPCRAGGVAGYTVGLTKGPSVLLWEATEAKALAAGAAFVAEHYRWSALHGAWVLK